MRFKYLGKETGFYLKPCHKGLVSSLNTTFNKIVPTLLASNDVKGEQFGTITLNEKKYPYFREPGKQLGLYGLEQKISTIFMVAEKQCKN